MTFAKSTSILALFLCAALSLSCSVTANKPAKSGASNSSKQPNDNANTVRSNVEELGLIVNVPYDAEDIVWKEDFAHKKIIAVLRFAPADSAKLVAEAEKIRPSEAANIPSATWFPAELIAQSEMGGDDILNGRSYAANQFFQEPYSNGRIVRIENTDYFVLELTSK